MNNPSYSVPLKNTGNKPVVIYFQNGRQEIVQPSQELDEHIRQSFGEIRSIKFKDDSRI